MHEWTWNVEELWKNSELEEKIRKGWTWRTLGGITDVSGRGAPYLLPRDGSTRAGEQVAFPHRGRENGNPPPFVGAGAAAPERRDRRAIGQPRPGGGVRTAAGRAGSGGFCRAVPGRGLAVSLKAGAGRGRTGRGGRGRRRRARGSGCSGTAARSALRSSARGRPRFARLRSARLGSVRPAQPSPASPGPPEPPRLGPRWSPLPRSGGESRLGAAAGGRPAAEVRGGGGRLGLARHSGRCPAGSSTDGFPLSPVREVPGSGFFLPGRPGGAGRCLATPAPGRSGPGCSARLFGYPLFLRRGSSEWKTGGPREKEEGTTLNYGSETLRESLLFDWSLRFSFPKNY